VSDIQWGQPEYEEYLSNGHSDDEIFKLMSCAMLQYSVFPVWADRFDPGNFWRLMDLDAYIWLRENRGKAIASEIGTKGVELESMRQKFPVIDNRYELPPVPRDGSFVMLPSGERVQCPVRNCRERFKDIEQCMRHCLKMHPGFCDFPDTQAARQPKKGLDALFDSK
jgi:hypothetical protein